jgi:uncharacterized membrane protein
MKHWLTLSVVLVALTAAGTLYVGSSAATLLPDPVPVHWDAQGQPNGFVPRDRILPWLLIMPGAMALIFLLLLALPWLSPRQFAIERFRPTYNYIVFLSMALLAYIQAGILLASLRNPPVNSLAWFMGGMFIFFALIGNVLGKVRRNFYVGIKTPWTLASETVWNQTHRLAAWLFVAGGLLGFVAVMAGVPFWWCLLVLLVVAFAPALYSLMLYKRLEREGKLDRTDPSQEVHVS